MFVFLSRTSVPEKSSDFSTPQPLLPLSNTKGDAKEHPFTTQKAGQLQLLVASVETSPHPWYSSRNIYKKVSRTLFPNEINGFNGFSQLANRFLHQPKMPKTPQVPIPTPLVAPSQ
jgi:hypothetical protein